MVEPQETAETNISNPNPTPEETKGADSSVNATPAINAANFKLNDTPVPKAETKSAMLVANEAESLEKGPEQVKAEDLAGLQTASKTYKKADITLGSSELIGGEKAKKYHDNYRKIFIISSLIVLLTGFASLLLRLYSGYLSIASQPIVNPSYQSYITTYQKGQQFVDSTLNLSDYQKYTSLSLLGAQGASSINTVVQENRLSYVQKKDILQNALNGFSQAFISNLQKIAALKDDISKYGFFSKELYDLLSDQEYSTSIKKYLLSLEMIKFESAINVFSYLDTFISSLANSLNISPNEAQTQMQSFANRGEKDIIVYLNNCYFNPYEIDYDCNIIGDFDRYYRLIDTNDSGFNIPVFKKTMYYVDNKLEQTDLPSFSILFNGYDPTQKEINFSVEVNTFLQDEVALIKKGIINPHIFIVSNLLDLIKQSMFVISENIDAKSVKVTPKIIKVGSTVFNVNNSSMSFALPIQKATEREITDYVQPALPTSP